MGENHQGCDQPRQGAPGQHQEEHPRSSSSDEHPEVDFILDGLEQLQNSLQSDVAGGKRPSGQCNVALIQLGPDVSEVFSIPRISQTAKAVGLTPGKTYDIANGFDLTQSEVRKRVLSKLRDSGPKLVVISPPCDQYSSLCNLAGYRGSSEWARKLMKAKVEVRHAGC